MKSIKEKAEEYTSNITNPVTNNAAFVAYMRGANYVLGEVEEFQKLFSTCMNAHTYAYLKNVIEELKK